MAVWSCLSPACCREDGEKEQRKQRRPYEPPPKTKRATGRDDQKKGNKRGSFSRVAVLDPSSSSSSTKLSEDLSVSLAGTNLWAFTLKELKVATQSFSSCSFLGEGGFGPVHKGFVDDRLRPGLKAQPVAVKLLDLDGEQGHREWLAEVTFLGHLRHPHLVKLIGYCCEEEHRLLVYEYMPRGSLDNQLFSRFSVPLPWGTRMKIALGAAKGLAFLHEAKKPVIYRDFKASNILLDSDYTAKLSDFGLAKDGPEGDETHASTQIMGTKGYVAPEYIVTGHLTTMSDVYSFGVVLLELLTGRMCMDKSRPQREQNLAEWAGRMLKNPRKVSRIMDPRLEGQYSEKGAQKVAELAFKCLSNRPKQRPMMHAVVETLEPLLEYNDVFVGPFVYIVPADDLHKDPKNEGKQEELKKRSSHNRSRIHSHDHHHQYYHENRHHGHHSQP
ncbi:hypothetical protein SAY87_007008 [Trapa incisa]|uniref:non-specific serine/threonine protein kinase n=1 Tax=Trapa incisa TaxID=236973 RepID=A0AAN7JZL3_9MYRT|nr:hypothetical protein SAY87_007008 [Trapa incisa]